MSKQDKLKNEKCLSYQEKIFESFESELTFDSDPSLAQHLQQCQNCRQYLENLAVMKKQLSESPSAGLKPDKRILKNIITYNRIKNGLNAVPYHEPHKGFIERLMQDEGMNMLSSGAGYLTRKLFNVDVSQPIRSLAKAGKKQEQPSLAEGTLRRPVREEGAARRLSLACSLQADRNPAEG